MLGIMQLLDPVVRRHVALVRTVRRAHQVVLRYRRVTITLDAEPVQPVQCVLQVTVVVWYRLDTITLGAERMRLVQYVTPITVVVL